MFIIFMSSANKKYDIITIGSATRDVYIESSQIISVHDDAFQTHEGLCVGLGSKVEVDNLYFTTGGSAVNTAITFAHQGLDAGIVAKVGRDSRGNSIIERLKQAGVSTEFVLEDEKELTAYSLIIHAPTGERSIFVYRGASSHMEVAEVDLTILKNTEWIFVTHLAGESAALFEPFLAAAKEHNVKIALNPGSTQLKMGKELVPLLEHVDIFFINQEEASLFTGIDYKKEEEVFAKLDEWVNGITVMTKGPDGVVVSDGTTRWDAPALKEPKFIDRTGAGDAFASGFTTAIIRSQSVGEAIGLGSANATGVIGKWGANRGLLTSGKEAEKFGTLNIKKLTL